MRIPSLFAAITKIDPGTIGYNGAVTDSEKAFADILNLVYMWSGIIAVLVIIFAGYLYITARGNPDQIKQGKDAIRGAVIGLIVVMLAFMITQFILGRF